MNAIIKHTQTLIRWTEKKRSPVEEEEEIGLSTKVLIDPSSALIIENVIDDQSSYISNRISTVVVVVL